jgi:hypothetical protein
MSELTGKSPLYIRIHGDSVYDLRDGVAIRLAIFWDDYDDQSTIVHTPMGPRRFKSCEKTRPEDVFLVRAAELREFYESLKELFENPAPNLGACAECKGGLRPDNEFSRSLICLNCGWANYIKDGRTFVLKGDSE